ncbi:MAG: hypothetical protein ACT4PL_13455 [Phycisphaerales bacterium]
MNKICLSAMAVFALAGSAVGQISSINGYSMVMRNFNDLPGSVLTVDGAPVGAGAFARPGLGQLTIAEQFALGEPGGFANRHLAHFSNDGGATPYSFQNNESFRIDTTINVTAGSNNPSAKEAGFTVFNRRTIIEGNMESPNFGMPVTFTDEGFMLVKTNGGVNGGGEIALFGGALPFFSFNSIGVSYVPGTTASISFTYFAPGEIGAAAAYEATFNGFSTGVKFFDNSADLSGNGLGGGSNIGVRAQNSRFPIIADFAITTYGGVSIIPTPGAVAILGLGGLLVARRRR